MKNAFTITAMVTRMASIVFQASGIKNENQNKCVNINKSEDIFGIIYIN